MLCWNGNKISVIEKGAALIYRTAGMAAVLMGVFMFSGCSSNHHAEVTMPNNVHCTSDSNGWFLFTNVATSCVDANGKTVGAFSYR